MKAQYTYVYAYHGTNRKGFATVSLRIYWSKWERMMVTTGLRLSQNEWDPKRNQPVRADHQEYLATFRNRIEQYEFELYRKGEPFTIETARRFLFERPKTDTFNAFCRHELANDKVLYPITRKMHNQTLNKLDAFNPAIPYGQVTYDTIRKFDAFLHGLGLHQNTIEGHHRKLKRYINIAIKKEILKRSPYLDFKIRKVPSDRQALTQSDLDAIVSLDYSQSPRLQRSRDLFVFACYTGLRYAEVQKLSRRNVDWQQNGIEITLSDFRKYPKPVFLPLHSLFDGKPERIALQWFTPDGQFQPPRISNQKLNEDLKTIRHDAHIDKPLSYHIARHTFATFIGMTGDVYLVMELLGHKDLKSCLVYVKSTPEIIRRKLKRIDFGDL